MQPVDVLSMVEMGAADGFGQRLVGEGDGRRVDVVGHQAIAGGFEGVLVCMLHQEPQVGTNVIVDEEDVLLVIAALGNMVGQAWGDDTRSSGHGRSLS